MVYSIGLVMLDGCVYAVADTSIEKYDSYTNTWRYDPGDMDEHCNGSVVAALEGHLYFIGNTPSLNQCRRRHRYYFPPWWHSVFQQGTIM